MSRLMRDWLGSTVEDALRVALAWKADVDQTSIRGGVQLAPASQPDSARSRSYHDDGSNLRISPLMIDTDKCHVQLVGFRDHVAGLPYSVHVSDGTTLIKARLAKTATDAYAKGQRKDFTQGTRGGILSLSTFELVVSRQDIEAEERITLFVKDFTWRGPGGSPTFGRPASIEHNTVVQALFQELRTTKKSRKSWPVVGDEPSMTYSQVKKSEDPAGPSSKISLSPSQSPAVSPVPTKTSATHVRISESRASISSPETPHSALASQIATQAGFAQRHSKHDEISVASGTNLKPPQVPRRLDNLHPSDRAVANSKAQLLKALAFNRVADRSDKQVMPTTTNRSPPPSSASLSKCLQPNEAEPASGSRTPADTKAGTSQRGQSNASDPIEIDESSEDDGTASSRHSQVSQAVRRKGAVDRFSPPLIHDQVANGTGLAIDTLEPSLDDKFPSSVVASGRADKTGDENRDGPSDTDPQLVARVPTSSSSNRPAENEDDEERILVQTAGTSRAASRSCPAFLHQGNFHFVTRFATAAPPSLEQQRLLKLPQSWHQPTGEQDLSSLNNPTNIHDASTRSSIQPDNGFGVHSVPGRKQDTSVDPQSTVDYTAASTASSRFEDKVPSSASASSHSIEWESSPDRAEVLNRADSLPPDTSAESSPVKTNAHSARSQVPFMSPDQVTSGHLLSSPTPSQHSRVYRPGSSPLRPHNKVPDMPSDHEIDAEETILNPSLPAEPLSSIRKTFAVTTHSTAVKLHTHPSRLPPSQDSKVSQAHNPFSPKQSIASTSERFASSSEPIIPGTFNGPHEIRSNAQYIPAIDGVADSDPPDHVTASLVDQQLRMDIDKISHTGNHAERSGPSIQPSRSSDHASGNNSKRRHNMTVSSSDPSRSPKRARLHALNLDHASQVTGDPFLKARIAKKEFLKNNTDELLRPPTAKFQGVNVSTQDTSSDDLQMYDAAERIPFSSPRDPPRTRDQPTRSDMYGTARTPSSFLAEPRWTPLNVRSERRSSPRSLDNHRSSLHFRNDSSLVNESTGPYPGAQANAPRPRSLRDSPPGRQSKSGNEIFDKFCTTYAAYRGDLKHFLGLCRKIKKLSDSGKMLHRSLWDDFIVRHKTAYVAYSSKCLEEGDEAIPYEQYYEEKIESPLYVSRVIDPATLRKALGEEQDMATATLRRPPISLASSPAGSVAAGPSDRRSLGNASPPHPYHAAHEFHPPRRRDDDNYRPTYSSPRPPPHRSKHHPSASHVPSSYQQDAPPTGPQHPRRSLPWNTPRRGTSKHTPAMAPPSAPRPASRAHVAKKNTHAMATQAHDGSASITTAHDGKGAGPSAGQRSTVRGNAFVVPSEKVAAGEGVMGQAETGALQSQEPWWMDDDTPFKEFVRGYEGLKIHGDFLRGTGTREPPRRLDVLGWQL